jgi:hypothetical protein
MRVVLSIGPVQVHIIAAHSPYEDSPEERRIAFWNLLAAELALAQRSKGSFVLLGIDANAHVGSTPSVASGIIESQEENDNGAALRSTAEEHGLRILNTFFAAGPTWTGSGGHRSRIDYLVTSDKLFDYAVGCWVCSGIDLATSLRDDHSVLYAKITGFCKALLCSSEGTSQRSLLQDCGAPKYAKQSLRDPARVCYFQRLLSQFVPQFSDHALVAGTRAQLDATAAGFVDHVKWAARQSFVLVADAPRRPWISTRTWEVIQMGSKCRGILRRWKKTAGACLCSLVLRCWHAVRTSLPPADDTILCAVTWYCGLERNTSSMIAQTLHSLGKLVRLRRPLLLYDRQVSLLTAADAAQKAADNNETRKLYSIVKGLAGKEAAPLSGIKHEDGSTIIDSSETTARWRRHFAALFRADVVDDPLAAIGILATPPDGLPSSAMRFPFTPSLEQVHAALFLLNGDKGLGPDCLSASVLQAGGWATAEIVHEIICQIIALEYVPVAWRGGKLVVLYKGKGPPSDCDSYRGLLIADHIAKILTTLLQIHMNDAYQNEVGPEQHGAVRGRGTALASLAIRAFIDACRLMAWSSFVLFIDLSKAFDYAVREVVMGWMQNAPVPRSARRDHLIKVGIPLDAVDDLMAWLETNGSLLQQMGFCRTTVGLVSSLHTGAWFRLLGDDKSIVTLTGGRQGCKLGALVFNLIYSVALKKVRESLLAAGIVLHVRRQSTAPFWTSDGCDVTWKPPNAQEAGPTSFHAVVEITYVDDEAITLAASSPAALLQAIDMLMKVLVDTFLAFGFRINWSAGKTEGFVVFRGKHASLEKRRLFVTNDAKIKLPANAGADHLRIVQHYKHLGSVIGPDGSSAADAPVRVRSAMTSYAPLAVKVFGTLSIARGVRIRLAHALVSTRLLYNVQTWSSLTSCMYKKLNHVYMRVLRRIAGACRFGKECKWSDLDVRRVLHAPSLQCLITQRRLLLLGSVLRNGSPALCSALAFVGSSADRLRLPWVRLVRDDLESLYAVLKHKLSELGDPQVHADLWCEFIKSHPQAWKQLVSQYHLDKMFHDVAKKATKFDESLPAYLAHVCQVCAGGGMHVAFASAKGLLCHKRSRHQMRNPLRAFLDASGVCPVCGGDYGCRTRALAHVTETRCRGKATRTCRDELESGGFAPFSDERINEFDELDRQARGAARAAGHTQPLARAPAKRPRVRARRNNKRRAPSPVTVVQTAAPHPAKRLRTKTPSAMIEWDF